MDLYFDKLRSDLEGDLLHSAFDRGRYATDASIYQMMPHAVILPKSVSDIKKTIAFARDRNLKILPRGAGTSQNGQTVNNAIVLDNSKYFNRLLSLDVQNRRCIVEPGMVLDELNRMLKPHDLWFPVDVSTSSRATIGGMAGNNSAGGRSIRYGIMRDNVHSIKAVLSDGREATFGLIQKDTKGLNDHLLRLLDLGETHRDEIEQRFPKVLRRVGGYNIDALLPETLSKRPGSSSTEADINLAHLIVGSEGTLAYSTAIELKLCALPTKKIMAICHFSSFYEAMDAAHYLVQLDPVTVELIDDTMISLARSIPLFQKTISDFVSGNPAALLVVEFAEETNTANLAKITDLNKTMAKLNAQNKDSIYGDADCVVILEPAADQDRISEMRKSGLNIMMSMKSETKPVSFVEDCAVPLESLAEYTQGLTRIFEKYGTSGTWYAHASVGCLHVRPLLNMKSGEDAEKMRAIALEAFELVKKYGGSHSGEHGDGISRSEFNPIMFGKNLTGAFKELKTILDPDGLFNPGKIIDAPKMNARDLFRFAPGYKVDDFETALDWSPWPGNAGGFQGAVEMCNNNGACRKLKGGVMCPSFRATRNEKDSTRGRANTLRLAISGQLDPEALTSDAITDTLALCVSCKACKRECPTGVDMAAMKIEMTALRTQAKGLSFHERLIAYLPSYAPLASRFASIANLHDKIPGLARFSSKITGFTTKRPLPRWRRDWFRDSDLMPNPIGQNPVILFIDTFSRYFEPENLRSAVRVLESAGYSVFGPVPKGPANVPICCGKTHLSTGNIEAARQSGKRLVGTYAPYALAGIPIVGLEPSCLFALKDELPSLLKTKEALAVADQALTFEQLLMRDNVELRLNPLRAKALLHGHCHQKAYDAMAPVEAVLKMIAGLEVSTIDASCCGMAGAFGYGKDTYDVSQKMGEADLLPKVRGAPADTIIIADGTSCRSQIKDGTQRDAFHVARVLDQQLQDH